MKPTQHLKKSAKALARPVVRLFDRRAQVAVEPRLADVEYQMSLMRMHFDRTLPVLLDRLSSQVAAERSFTRSINDLYEKIERLRLDVISDPIGFHGIRAAGSEGPARILDPDKLARMGDQIQLNLGAGGQPIPGYLNVDDRALAGIDVVAPISNLPFERGSVAEIFSSHLLERFSQQQLTEVLLPYWVSLLQRGGRIVCVVSDLEATAAGYASGESSFSDFQMAVYGDQERLEYFHLNGFSQDSLVSLLTECGLSDVRVKEAGRRQGSCYEMEVEGTMPSGSKGADPVKDG